MRANDFLIMTDATNISTTPSVFFLWPVCKFMSAVQRFLWGKTEEIDSQWPAWYGITWDRAQAIALTAEELTPIVMQQNHKRTVQKNSILRSGKERKNRPRRSCSQSSLNSDSRRERKDSPSLLAIPPRRRRQSNSLQSQTAARSARRRQSNSLRSQMAARSARRRQAMPGFGKSARCRSSSRAASIAILSVVEVWVLG
jgi:hypothetical protein